MDVNFLKDPGHVSPRAGISKPAKKFVYSERSDSDEDCTAGCLYTPLIPVAKQRRMTEATPGKGKPTFLFEDFPSITLRILSSHGLQSEDLARLEVTCSAFKAPANISPDVTLSLPEAAALDVCLTHGSFMALAEEERHALKRRCGGTWKLVLRFLTVTVDCTRWGKSQVAAGCSHSMVLSSNGGVFSFGSGEEGQLGHGTFGSEAQPRLISSLNGTRIVHVAAGRSRSMLVSETGELFRLGRDCYGDHDNAQSITGLLLQPQKVQNLEKIWVVQVALGSFFTAVLSQEGRVYTFSWGDRERMGHATDTNCTEPKALGGPLDEIPVVQIAGGHCYLLALALEPTPRGRSVWSVGCGLGGKLGHGSRNDEKVPREIAHFRSLNFQPVAVAAGAWHAAALSTDGRVATWGWGRHGCLGHGSDQCELVPRVLELFQGDGGPRAWQVSAGDYTTFVLGRGGEVWSFGHADSLCLGHPVLDLDVEDGQEEAEGNFEHAGAGRRRDLSAPRRIEALEDLPDGDCVVQISPSSAGHWDAHMLALTKNGIILSCGAGAKGQLGFELPEGEIQLHVPQAIKAFKL